MAKISILSTDAGRTFTAGGSDEIIGSSAADLVFVDASAAGVVVNGNGGADVITLEGGVADYKVQQDGSRLKFTNAAGGVSFVALTANAVTINFDDAVAVAKVDGAKLMLGNQDVTGLVLPTSVTGTSAILGGTGIMLKDGQDVLHGSALNDVYTSYILDNSNTFESGDRIIDPSTTDTDKVFAEIGNSQNIAINAKTTNVENFYFQAQSALDGSNDDSDNFVDSHWNTPLDDQDASFHYGGISQDGISTIDAEDLDGVRQLWSDNSRANLVIEDVRENSHVTTIGMRDTDAGNVNYEVYFNTDNITKPGDESTGAALTIRAIDVLNLKKAGNGVNTLPFTSLTLTIGTQDVTLDINFAALTADNEYEALRAAIDKALDDKGFTSIDVTLGPKDTAVFSINVETFLKGDPAGEYFPIILKNNGPDAIKFKSYELKSGSLPPSGNVVFDPQVGKAIETPFLTQVDVILDNVARNDAAGSGDLVIGDMSEIGIQQFNVQVDRNSHIDQLASTNNWLEVVNVTNDFTNNLEDTHSGTAGANGNLIINQIDDVRVFDAHTMVGNVTLGAALSQNVTEKYLNLVDTQDDPAFDNSEIDYRTVVDKEFSYDFGAGDDTLVLTIDKSNMADAGTTNREDFVLEINGNGGKDDITLQIGDDTGETPLGSGIGDFSNWYANSKLNANLTINTQAGDDTVRAYGAGDRIINTGADNDTVYIDNSGDYPSGRKAIWVYNTHFAKDSNVLDDQNGPTGDVGLGLQSDVNDTYHMYKVSLKVSFMGFEATAVIPNTNGHTTDLQINQAIKAAINGDAELSKLLHASDGPANTLVIESLIDGDMDTANGGIPTPEFTLTAPTSASLTAGEVNLLFAAYGVVNDATAVHDAIVAAISDFNDKGDYDSAYAETSFGADYTGVNSTLGVGDNTIEGGIGNDVIVLGTMGDDSMGILGGIEFHQTLGYSNDTLVYNGYNNGLDTVVNFQFGHETLTQTLSIVDVDLISYTEGSTAAAAVTHNVNEQFTAQFKAATAAGTVAFNGVTVNIAGTETAAQVAALFIAQSANFTNYTAAAGAATGTVVFTANAANAGLDLDDAEVTDFTVSASNVTPTTTGVILAVVENIDGGVVVDTPAKIDAQETFTVRFGQAEQAGVLTFDGVTINLLAGETGYNIAQAVQTGNYANWTVVSDADNTDNQVTFASKTLIGDVTNAFTAPEATVVVDQYNEDNFNTVNEEDSNLTNDDQDLNTGSFIVPTYTVTGEVYYRNVDYIDFSDYIDYADVNASIIGDQFDLSDATFLTTLTGSLANDTVAIYNNPNLGVDGVFTAADLATTTLALDQVYMIESNAADQNGRYDMFHVSHAASATASAVTVQLIGTVDFGAELTASGWVA
jgi:hypothetical protein